MSSSSPVPPDLPPPLLHARSAALWWGLGLLALVGASFWSLDLQWAAFFAPQALSAMGRFVGEFFPPDLSAPFVAKVAAATLETLAMSAWGTLLAAVAGLVLAVPAARRETGPESGLDGGRPWVRWPTRWLLNALRAVPELVWAALLLISAGLGPLAGTLALAVHTSGVLGRLFAEALENAPPGPAQALRLQGVGRWVVLAYATLPQVLPQLLSYTLYRWENNIRAAAVLGVVGAGGLGQLLAFHMGLFQMPRTATIVGAMLALVALVDGLSYLCRRSMTR
ncbi:phosphonate ABC transporter, permease protein PhnE [Ideonella livida]|uniref:Phosphonate ABC transporter, permease protein PhnE n=1 Tax=Ideonella livida TaxID=2707176 RepID=A0A7C9PEZ7_9BURK|nr:phosphonate ABC transporter, permease protein PhnE [Ideonella livida]NDY90008.1 phosphonate ABC transporter, permease protein PhnE [Ideonella livida]